jgi:hypothetical protein
MSYSLAMSTFDDGPRVGPIPSGDDEKVAPEDLRQKDRAEKPVSRRPWLFIGQRFLEGIPFTKTPRR